MGHRTKNDQQSQGEKEGPGMGRELYKDRFYGQF